MTPGTLHVAITDRTIEIELIGGGSLDRFRSGRSPSSSVNSNVPTDPHPSSSRTHSASCPTTWTTSSGNHRW